MGRLGSIAPVLPPGCDAPRVVGFSGLSPAGPATAGASDASRNSVETAKGAGWVKKVLVTK
jgi:hypothetical protein